MKVKGKSQKVISWILTLSMMVGLFVGIIPNKEAKASASSVSIAGDFNGWNPDANLLTTVSEGVWEGTIEIPEAKTYGYKGVVDGKDWHGFKIVDAGGNSTFDTTTENQNVKFTFYEGINVVLDDINYPNGLVPTIVGAAEAFGNWNPESSNAKMECVEGTVFKYVYDVLRPGETLEFAIILNPQNASDWDYKISDGLNNLKFTNSSDEAKDISIYFDASKGYGKDSVTDTLPQKPLPTEKPKLNSSTPQDGETNVLPTTKQIDFKFNKNVSVEDDGKIVISPEVPFTTSMVNNNTLRISLKEFLKVKTSYTITVGEGSIKDEIGNVNDEEKLSFTTADELIETPKVNGDGTVTFKAKYDGDELYIVGSLNGWDNTGIPMAKNGEGMFEKTIPLAPGIYEYKFNTVSGEWKNDFIDPLNPNMSNGNSMLVVPGLTSSIPSEAPLGDTITLEAEFLNEDGNKQKVSPVWTLKEAINNVSIEGDVLKIGTDATPNTKITIVGTYEGYKIERAITILENMYTYTIHYFRYDDKSLDWDMWIWSEGKNGEAYKFKNELDEEGFAVGIVKYTEPKISIITRLGENWTAQEEEREIEIPKGEDSTEVWIVQGDKTVYTSRPDTSKRVMSALADSKTKIVCSTTHAIEGNTINATLEDSQGNTIPVTTKKLTDKLFEVTTKKDIDVTEAYEIFIEGFNSSKVTMRDVLNDSEFVYKVNDLGLSYNRNTSTFKVWAPTAKQVSVALYNEAGTYNNAGIVTDHTDGDETEMTKVSAGVWEITIPQDLESKYYMYKVEFADGTVNYAIDPYAKAVSANGQRGAVIDLNKTNPSGFDPMDKPFMINSTDAVLYELHVRDFSIGENSGMVNKGKFKAFTETGTKYNGVKTGVDHLKELGVTHVHLLPAYDFKTVNELTVDDESSKNPKFNWGYDPQNYNVPEGSYSTDPTNPEARVKEFKEMVQTLHDNGIRVIMDVVYNHTFEIEEGPFDKIVPGYYYRTDNYGKFTNGSGCGNEVASERPMVRKFIKDSVRYWSEEYGVDGYRFDLMGLIDIDTMEQITTELHNEIDSTLLIYGEPWTAGGSPLAAELQTLKGSQKDKNFAVFNDNLRNAVRSASGNGNGKDPGFATGATGQEDRVVQGIKGAIDDFTNAPTESINYVAAHDNLNIWDKVMADMNKALKPETTTNPHAIITESNPLENEAVRRSLLSNGIVFTSQGIPFIHAGDEMLRSKYGDHNSYKSSDEINKIRWELKTEYEKVFDYYQGLIELRKNHPAFKMTTKEAINNNLQIIHANGNVIVFKLKNFANGDPWKNIVVIYNANKTKQVVNLPNDSSVWNIVVDETAAGVETIGVVNGNAVEVAPLSMMVLYDIADDYEPVATTIEIEEDAIGLEAGSTKTITAVVKDQKGRIMQNQNITWISSDESVATVTNGRIQAISEGKAIITGISGELQDTVEVNVGKLNPMQITLTGQEAVYETTSIQLKAEVFDQYNQKILSPTITWTSSDANIATVDTTGKVLGVKPGRVIITAKSGNVEAEKEIVVKKYEQRAIELKYVREDGKYEDWNLWVWGTGTEDVDQVDFTEINSDYAKTTIKVAPGVTSVGFIVRKGTDWDTAKQDIQDDRYITLHPEQVITKVTVRSMVKELLVVPYVSGPVLRDGDITFYYRDEELYKEDKLDTIEKVEVVINGIAYEMIYDKQNEYFKYTIKNAEEGIYEYLFRIIKDGETIEISDPKNTDDTGKSIIEIVKLDLDIKVAVEPKVIDYNQNAVLTLDIKNTKTGEDVKAKEIHVDLSTIGGSNKVEIPTELNAVTIAVSQKVAAGVKTLPIEILDEYGIVHRTSTNVEVKTRAKTKKADFDWDEAVIYFMLTDRFNDGDKSNNDPYGIGDYDLDAPGAYHGGDFKGVTQKLDYLKQLGVNTIWITPIVENIKHDVRFYQDPHITPFYGYHGYWASNFERLNPHLGTVEEFHNLIDAANEKGIKIMVDVVINHAGYGLRVVEEDSDSVIGYPTDEDRDRFKGMFRENPVDGDDITGELSGLPDFITEDPEVRDQVISWQVAWVDEIARTSKGNTIDYFRVDTVKHVQNEMLVAFKNALTKVKPDFKMIGESYGATPGNDLGHLSNGKMDSLLDFDFKYKAADFVNGNIDGVESYLENRNQVIGNDYMFGQFLGSHDEDGFLTRVGNDKNKLKIAASLQATSKGQPVIYYGEELGLGGKSNYPYYDNRYDMPWDEVEGNDVLSHYRKIFSARQKYLDIFAKGNRTKLAGSNADGYLVFERKHKNESVLVGLNLGDAKGLELSVPFAKGEEIEETYGGKKYTVGEEGTVVITLPSMEDGGTFILGKIKKEEPSKPEEPGDGGSGSSGGSSGGSPSKPKDKIVDKVKDLEDLKDLDKVTSEQANKILDKILDKEVKVNKKQAEYISNILNQVGQLTPKVEEKGGKKVVKADKEDLKKAIEDANKALEKVINSIKDINSKEIETLIKENIAITINIENIDKKDTIEVMIPADIMAELKEKAIALQIKTPSGDIVLPAGAISSNILINAKDILINREPTKDIDILKQKLASKNKGLISYGIPFDFEALAIDTNGNKTKIKQFNYKVKVRIPMDKKDLDSIKDKRKAGVYYIGDNANVEFKGGKFEENAIIFETDHFSTYMVMEYNKTFTDIQNHWAKEVIEVLAARHITGGITENLFAPDQLVTRGQMVTFIGRALGINPNKEYQNPFSDLKEDAYYYGYALALRDAEIVGGYSDGTFRPDEAINREQMFTMIMAAYKYLTQINLNDISGYEEADFADMDKVSSWARESIKAGRALDIVGGVGDNKVDPKGKATRAAVAKMIVKLVELTN